MATKIRRCLYIGLGGTGMTSLLHTKRMFIETYGEVPPMIGFLGIDTDGGVYNRELQSKYGAVKIEPNEQMPIIVNQAAPIYQVSESKFTWVPKENLSSLTSMNLGAGAIRSNGRFALTVNYDKVIDRIKNKINEITNAKIADNNNYELLSESPVELHMVFSIAGGTGSRMNAEIPKQFSERQLVFLFCDQIAKEKRTRKAESNKEIKEIKK